MNIFADANPLQAIEIKYFMPKNPGGDGYPRWRSSTQSQQKSQRKPESPTNKESSKPTCDT
jgi:hypothetical protein